jgi:hypothetical protein
MFPQVMLALTFVLGMVFALVESYHSILFFNLMISILDTLAQAQSTSRKVLLDLAGITTRTRHLLQRSMKL